MVSDSVSQDLRQKAHERVAEQSFRNLQKARDEAAQKSRYDWKLTHECLYSEFKKRFRAAYDRFKSRGHSVRPRFGCHCRDRLRQNNIIYDASYAHEKYLLYLHYINNTVLVYLMQFYKGYDITSTLGWRSTMYRHAYDRCDRSRVLYTKCTGCLNY